MGSKCLLIADPHAGVKSDSDLFLNLFKDFFENFVPEQITKHGVDTIFILGDLFDNRNNLGVKTLNIVYSAFNTLVSKHPSIKIYILLGNHDIYYRNKRDIHSLAILDGFEQITIIDEPTHLNLSNRNIELTPWLTDIEEINKVFQHKADIAMGHYEINGFEMVPGIKEHDGITPNRFRDNFKLTFSGHFHLRNDSKDIIYVGNPYQTKWSDYGNDKGMYLLDLETLNYTFIEYESAPKFKKIFLSQVKKQLVDLKKEVPNNFVSLILDEEIKPAELDKLNYLISSFIPSSFIVTDIEKNFGAVSIEDISSNPMDFLYSYITAKEFNSNIDKNILTKKIDLLYNRLEV